MSGAKRVFVAFRPCGCWDGCIMERSPSAAEWQQDWQADGSRVETMTVEDARAVTTRCAAHPRPEQMTQRGFRGDGSRL